ncbi:MAG: peptidoglycan DD-metalloendopeptidase family protein [Limnochordales bacterium]|nr:MAG: peptidase M23 [Bacillota bacterium]
MRNSMRFAVVLFFLSVLAMVAFMGGDTAEHSAVGGPGADVPSLAGRSAVAEPDDFIAADAFTAEDTVPGLLTEAGAGAVATLNGQVDDETAVAQEGADGVTDELAARDGGEAPQAAAAEPEPGPTVVTHVVQRGETLWDIALAYGIDVDTIVAANDIPDINRLQVGQELKILTIRGALHRVQRGESLWDISRAYNVSMDEIIAVNGIANPSRIQVNQELIIPGGQAAAAALRREQLVSSSGQLLRNFDWPTRGRISSRYGPRWGRMHYGLDLAVPIGTPIYAAANGTVTHAGSMGTYGILVIIDHGNGVETRYAHLSRTAVRVGQRVSRGQLIAYSGNTGNSTGPHLHFEIRHRGQAVDPEQYLKR